MELLEKATEAISPGGFSALGLAYMGDAVYELLARARALEMGDARVSRLHSRGARICCAEAQAGAARAIVQYLTEEEKAVFLRGRNAKPHSSPKNAQPQEYALATALEALFGWLYLSGRTDRLLRLWQAVLEHFNEAGE